jgi:hypothetical protein
MPEEMNDYSGPFNPNLTFDCFSKEFLLKLMKTWQYAWLHMSGAWYEAVKSRWGDDAANACELEAWVKVGERVNPRFAKIANIELKTVLDSLKAVQLPLDNTTDDLFRAQAEIINPNHVIWTIPRCKTLEVFERSMPERIKPMCEVLEPAVIAKYLINPKVKLKALKLPPRKSKDEIACQWEITLEE